MANPSAAEAVVAAVVDVEGTIPGIAADGRHQGGRLGTDPGLGLVIVSVTVPDRALPLLVVARAHAAERHLLRELTIAVGREAHDMVKRKFLDRVYERLL